MDGDMTTAGDAHYADPWAGADWRRAAACGDAGCVEVASVGDQVAVRDSKDRRSAILVFSAIEWQAFVAAVRVGTFDVTRIRS
jgi:hypothetical protein